MENTQFFTTELATAYWLHSMEIENYTINDNLTVDVDGSVWINNMNLDYISVQFGIVTGYFDCSYNNLKSLTGCPDKVEGVFNCSDNKLEHLKGSPYKVGESFFCKNNKITILEGFLTEIGANFSCYKNPITDFSYFDFEVAEDICFTPTKDIDYLDSYKDKVGDIKMSFNEFKRLQDLQKLNKKLNDDLPVNTKMTKKMKI